MIRSAARHWLGCNLVGRGSRIAGLRTVAVVAGQVRGAAVEEVPVAQSSVGAVHTELQRGAVVDHNRVGSVAGSSVIAEDLAAREGRTGPVAEVEGERRKVEAGTCSGHCCIAQPFRHERHDRLGQGQCPHDSD